MSEKPKFTGNGLDDDLKAALEDIGYQPGEKNLEPHTGEIIDNPLYHPTEDDTRSSIHKEGYQSSEHSLVLDFELQRPYFTERIKEYFEIRKFIKEAERQKLKIPEGVSQRRHELFFYFATNKDKILNDAQLAPIYEDYMKRISEL